MEADSTELVDELYFVALQDHDIIFPISDEDYAEELQLQEVLANSSLSSSSSPDLQITSPENQSGKMVVVKGESSSGRFCVICMDSKPPTDFFKSPTCSHFFCLDCMSNYVASKIQENISTVKCPDSNCEATISPNDCQEMVPKQVLERWETALVESMILGSGSLYCPFKDCSALLADDEAVVGAAECPSCHRLFCVQCKVGWHHGLDCTEFQTGVRKIDSDHLALKLAEEKKWKRCPRCKFFVEKTEGCLHIVCRCHFEFCYGCGSKWGVVHHCPQLDA